MCFVHFSSIRWQLWSCFRRFGSNRSHHCKHISLSISKLLGYSLAITKKQLLNSARSLDLFLAYGNGMFVWALKWVDTGFASLLCRITAS
jgi:hypothetical protein